MIRRIYLSTIGVLLLTLGVPLATVWSAETVLPSSTVPVELHAAPYTGSSEFLLPLGNSIETLAGVEGGPVTGAVMGDSSQNWRFTNRGAISSETKSGLILGSLTADMATVWNYGTITSLAASPGGPSGIKFTNGGQVYNDATGRIEGPDGVHTDNGSVTVENYGTINGSTSGGSAIYSGEAVWVTKYLGGLISGGHFGINANGNAQNAFIINHGTINTNKSAINLYNGNKYAIYNSSTGVIMSGGDRAIDLQGTDGYLLNEGTITALNVGLYAQNATGLNIYINAGSMTATNDQAMFIDDDNSKIINLGTLTGNGNAIEITGDNNQLVLGTQTYLPRIGRWVYGPGSILNGDAVSTGTGNSILLTDSGTEGSALTGFASLTMDGVDWSLANDLTLNGSSDEFVGELGGSVPFSA